MDNANVILLSSFCRYCGHFLHIIASNLELTVMMKKHVLSKNTSYNIWSHLLPASFYDNKYYQNGKTIGVNKPYYLCVIVENTKDKPCMFCMGPHWKAII